LLFFSLEPHVSLVAAVPARAQSYPRHVVVSQQHSLLPCLTSFVPVCCSMWVEVIHECPSEVLPFSVKESHFHLMMNVKSCLLWIYRSDSQEVIPRRKMSCHCLSYSPRQVVPTCSQIPTLWLWHISRDSYDVTCLPFLVRAHTGETRRDRVSVYCFHKKESQLWMMCERMWVIYTYTQVTVHLLATMRRTRQRTCCGVSYVRHEGKKVLRSHVHNRRFAK